MSGPILPDVKVELGGQNGNAFAILGRVRRALREAGHGDRVEEYMAEATSGDYDNLLAVTCRWVDA